MKRRLPVWLLVIGVVSSAFHVRAETETIDLKALAKKARPAVMLLVVSDAAGKEIATGTGFLISSDGKLITNHHVIEGAASAVAKAENGGLFPVEGVLADDPKNDLVLLKLKGKELPFLPLGNSDKIEVGTRIAVIGSPLGLEGTMSEGIVSAVRDLVGMMRLLQITAPISPGSSGSPVLNANGEAIGVAKALLREGQSLGFAVPVAFVRTLVTGERGTSTVRPLGEPVASDASKIFDDPDFTAVLAAEVAEDYIGMLKHAQVLLRRYPENALANAGLGVANTHLGLYTDAIPAFVKAIKLEPDFGETWYDLGVCYGKVERTRDAIAAYQQAVKLKPDFGWAWRNLGLVYELAGRADDAVGAFQQAVRFQSDLPDAWLLLAAAYHQVGRKDDARDALQQAKKLKPELLR